MAALRNHVTGAIERGEKEAIVEVPAEEKEARARVAAGWRLQMWAAIEQAMRRMKTLGTTGCSVACLKQNVNTRGLTVPVPFYHANFAEVAREVAELKRFSLSA